MIHKVLIALLVVAILVFAFEIRRGRPEPQGSESAERPAADSIDGTDRGDAPPRTTAIVVERSQLLRAGVVGALKEDGYRVVEASGCDEAWGRVDELQDGGSALLAVVDIDPPMKGSVELVRRLLDTADLVRVVVMAADEDRAHSLLGQELASERFQVIAKPVSRESLLTAIEDLGT